MAGIRQDSPFPARPLDLQGPEPGCLRGGGDCFTAPALPQRHDNLSCGTAAAGSGAGCNRRLFANPRHARSRAYQAGSPAPAAGLPPPGCGRCEVACGRDGRCGLSTESRTRRVPVLRAVRPGNRRRATASLWGREGIGLQHGKTSASRRGPIAPLPCALLAKLLPAVQAPELSEFTTAPALFHPSRPPKRGSGSSRMNDSQGEFGTS